MAEAPDPKVALTMIFYEGTARLTGYKPSKELCEEFADRVLQEARDHGHEIRFQAVTLKQ